MEREGRLKGERGSVKEFNSLKELAAELKKCRVLNWWRKHMFGIHDLDGFRDVELDLKDLD